MMLWKYVVIFALAFLATLGSALEEYSVMSSSGIEFNNPAPLLEKELVRYRRDVNGSAAVTGSSAANVTAAPTTVAKSVMPLTTSLPVKIVKENHNYYHLTTLVDDQVTANYRRVFQYLPRSYKRHKTLSSANRMALQINLRFNFMFYGHDDVKKVTIATGGFLYMSEYLHRYLTYSQYIAPLMTDFDTRLGSGDIAYADTGSAFFARWENVHIKNQANLGNFTFEIILHQNGTIVFVYEKIPVPISKILTADHSLKTGLSDAYYLDKDIPGNKYYFSRRIIRYNAIPVKQQLIMTDAIMIFHPLPTCVQQKSCRECINARTSFTCNWCSGVRRCSSGIDRLKQQWEKKGCHKVPKVKDCPAPGLDAGVIFVIFLIVALFIASIVGLIMWIYYAYTHPTSRSGICLMEHRPSVLLARFNAWKAGGSSQQNNSDVYRVNSVV